MKENRKIEKLTNDYLLVINEEELIYHQRNLVRLFKKKNSLIKSLE